MKKRLYEVGAAVSLNGALFTGCCVDSAWWMVFPCLACLGAMFVCTKKVF